MQASDDRGAVRVLPILPLTDFRFSERGGEEIPCRLPASRGALLGKDAAPLCGECRFSADFFADEPILRSKHVFLRALGVDTVCSIEINGRCAGRIRDLYLDHIFEIAPFLIPGKNTVSFVFRSAASSSEGEDAAFRRPRRAPDDVGIFGSVSLTATDAAVIRSLSLRQRHQGGGVDLEFSASIRGSTDGLRASAALVSPTGEVSFGGLYGDLSSAVGVIHVRMPVLWNPCGSGGRPLYTLTVTLYHGNTQVDSYECRVGLRELSLPDPERPLALRVNGRTPLLFGTASDEPLCVTGADPLSALAEAKLNFVYLSAAGGYPSDGFLSRCDELGLLAAIELPLSGAPGERRPTDDELLAELRQGSAKLCTHPSVALLLCPEGDEKLLSLVRSALPDVPAVALPQGGIPGLVRSSPSLVSFPEEETLAEVLSPEERNPFSPAVEAMESTPGCIAGAVASLAANYRYPFSFSDLLCTVGAAAADGCRALVESCRSPSRRAEVDAILLGRLTDGAPRVSDSLVDSSCRAKPVALACGNFFSPLYAYLRADGERVSLFASLEGKTASCGDLTFRVTEDGCRTLSEQSATYAIGCGECAEVFSTDLGEQIRKVGREHIVLIYRLKDPSGSEFTGSCRLVRPKDLPDRPIPLRLSVGGEGQNFEIRLQADGYLSPVLLSLAEGRAAFSENALDVAPLLPARVLVKTDRAMTKEEFSDLLVIRTVGSVILEKDNKS